MTPYPRLVRALYATTFMATVVLVLLLEFSTHSLGNAVVPQVAYEVGCWLMGASR